GHGDQIVASSATVALLDRVSTVDLGLHRLKDFEGAIRLYQIGDGDFPPLRTPGSVELPTPATGLLGRERELYEAVSVVYGKDPRILTVIGPGGTGKTRFAIELARLLADDAQGGTVFVALAPLRDPELDLPPVNESEAVALFVEHAQAVRPGVAGSAVVSELCRRLDRLPLALELAAARTKLLAPEALLERLEDRLDLLRGARDAEERHATLRATIAWSYDLLEEDERRLLAR